MPPKPPIPYGLHERLATHRLVRKLAAAAGHAEWADLDPEEAPLILARHLADAITRILRSLPSKDRETAQVTLLNRLIETVHGWAPDAVDADETVLRQILTAYLETPEAYAPERPGIPLSDSDLLVNARGEHRIGHELAREIASADRIDLICSFIKWGGVRLLLPAIEKHLAAGKPMRVITTTYLASTDQRALDTLLAKGAEIRVSYDTRRTRLHAKAWLLHRESGFSTAYIGSSNLSATAQTDGLEWNVRVSQVDAGRIIRKFEAAFDNYWGDGEFVPYDGSDESRETFARAIRRESQPDDTPILYFDVRPWPFQQEILDRLETDREVHGRTRNLVVAATGTGKTVVAALDYRRLRENQQVDSLLFVAHRQEILKQSLLTFRHALRDGAFGELQVAGHRPDEGAHVFASIQSLSRENLEAIDPKAFDMVIVDEVHHGSAPTYERLLRHVEPKYLLGLTATPERADGRSILPWFDGHTTAEIRVWDAIERGLLVPFQYFGVHDNTDLQGVSWDGGSYRTSELEQVYTADHVRVNQILTALQERVLAPREMRALGFCVSIRHADFMARAFNAAGIPSVALHSESDPALRHQVISRLQKREVNVIFTVDLFNEGVDIPFVDTVLFLRPTESATVFIQQLGRGLRHHDAKECLTVLDFVGRARREFRYDNRFRALLQVGRSKLKKQVEEGFPLLPSGCSIQLDRASQEIILENLAQSIGSDRRSLLRELQKDPNVSLRQFLEDAGLEVEELYRGNRWFSSLVRDAGGTVYGAGPNEDALGRGLGRLLHLDDPDLLRRFADFARGTTWAGTDRELALLTVPLIGPEAFMDPAGAIASIRAHPAIADELAQLLDLLLERVSHVPRTFDAFPDVPLKIHCQYSRDQVMAGFGIVKNDRLYQPREGVVFDPETRTNLLFVTVNKSEKDYSPSTMYEDYALSPTEFHWQSQATTRPETEKGRRHWGHIDDGITPLLFVRESKKDEYGNTAPYFFLGPVRYERHQGERPMNVIWAMEEPIPQDWMRRLRVAG